MLCPVRALKIYVDRSKLWRKSPQLLVCFGAGRHELATSKHRISHWVRDAITLADEVRGLPSLPSAFGRTLLGPWLPLKLFSEALGVAEEERNIASVTEMVDTTISRSANPESSQYAADRREPKSCHK